jgi:hypothetical protein
MFDHFIEQSGAVDMAAEISFDNMIPGDQL